MKPVLTGLALSGLALPAGAEIVAASPSHYTLKHEAMSTLSPEDMWERLIQPETWWSPDHTWSGDAANLSLDPQAGGLWQEAWEGSSVAHGTVLTVMEGKMLRLDAPFGPLQGMGVTVIWTITIKPDGNGSHVTFEEVANGAQASALDQIAPAVDAVKQEAITRLTAPAAED
ncbi:SRPBCC family protein [Henriciella aquimarina]|uniref:SRPBCC family protein n=1 Tax=Henriciella aquimarina TaxID=545261 RepID=UPI000A06584F|nr:SRPBCC domain-containing protein [Henriciella aquimarina]